MLQDHKRLMNRQVKLKQNSSPLNAAIEFIMLSNNDRLQLQLHSSFYCL